MEDSKEVRRPEAKQGERKFNIVSPQETDSLSTLEWKDYLDSNKLKGAWIPPENSPWGYYQKTKTVNSIDNLAETIRPRYSEGEQRSEKGIENLIGSSVLGKDTAVILDSGGAHSVAMAVKLVEQGYQPVVMFNSVPHPRGTNRSEQELATLLYFAGQMEKLRQEGEITPDAPPVFILNAHRGDTPEEGEVDNSYTYQKGDFPTAQELDENGIRKVVYLNEGDQNGLINETYQSPKRLQRDLKPIAEAWEKAGIKIVYTGVSPWEQEHRRLGVRTGLSYPDMPPEVYGEDSGIAMHRNRERFILTKNGELVVYNERGLSRNMNSEEIEHFRSEIEKQIDLQPKNKIIAELYKELPKEEK